MLHLICDSILSMYCQSCYSVCKPDIDLVLDVHPVERPARAYRNTSRAPRGRCLDPHVQVFLLDEHLGQGRYPILKIPLSYQSLERSRFMVNGYTFRGDNFCFHFILSSQQGLIPNGKNLLPNVKRFCGAWKQA